jgi:uncharacterized membrane protein YagU involved in acid resistance
VRDEAGTWRGDLAVLAGLGVIAALLVAWSWRKWTDPLVDFGRELYLPWRLSQGAVLYRDVQHLYGPLSAYFNALVFRLAGVGLGRLVIANLVIYAGILALLFYLLRQGWGRLAAGAGGVFFVVVFSFAHLVGFGNFNFVTPYAHEMTHGLLVLLALAAVGRSWCLRPAPGKIFAVGLLTGLSVLLKPEIMLGAAAVLLGMAGGRAGEVGWRAARREAGKMTGWFVAGLVAPVFAAIGLFHAAGLPWAEAARDANAAWWNVFTYAGIAHEPLQQWALGTDAPWANFLGEAGWGAGAVAVALGAAALCRWLAEGGVQRRVLLGFMLALGVVGFCARVPWLRIGWAFPGLLILAGVAELFPGRSGGAAEPGARAARVLLWCLAAALLARMALNVRIFHYGFVQAGPAAAVGCATLLETVPAWWRLAPPARVFYRAFILAVLGSIGVAAIQKSAMMMNEQTLAVGTGDDRLLTFGPDVDPIGQIVEHARVYLARGPGARTLMVLPEGGMLNYLVRQPNSVSDIEFGPSLLAGGREMDVVRRLRAAPPDRVALVSRDLTIFGVARFGDRPDDGGDILEFVRKNYRPVYQIGGDPLNPKQEGMVIFARRAETPASAK